MKVDRWSALRCAVEAALCADSPRGREAVLAHQCGDDPALLEEARALLSRAESPVVPADPPWGNAASAILAAEDAGRNVGRRFGAYRAVQVIAAGPGGTVLRATRDDSAFDKDVAVKVLPRAQDAPEALRRFERERRILARLAHPAISTLLDAGIADDGSPYIVMEFVEGTPITDHCAARALSPRARVALLRQACDAVAHAHAAGVIHRDLKPANLLVTPRGDLKLIDFGIARLLAGGGGGEGAPADATEHGRLLGTMNYMSPEQVTGAPIDARTDVHALGLILYELLAGRPAFDLASLPVAAAAAAIAASDPQRLSAADRRLRGDLEHIVSRATEKDPALRYASVAAFDEDLRRFLEHLPVAAARPVLTYRARKLIRRRPALAAAAAALALGALATSAAVLSGAMASQREAERARAVSAFLGDVLRSADPFTGAGPRPRELTDLLREAARRVDAGAIPDARTESDIRHHLGAALAGRGFPREAEHQYRRAHALRAALLGPSHPDTLESQIALAGVLVTMEQFAEARALLRVARSALTPTAPEALVFTVDLTQITCDLFGGNFRTAHVGAEALLERARSMSDPERPALAAAVVAITAFGAGEHDRAESVGAPALQTLAERGCTHPIVGYCASTLAAVAEIAGHADTAERRYRQAYESFRSTLGDGDPRAALLLVSLAEMLGRQERYDEAEPYLRDALRVLERSRGLADSHTAAARVSLAAVLQGLGRLHEASTELERTIAAPGMRPDSLASARSRLALVRAEQGRLEDAEQLARAALDGIDPAARPEAHLIAQEVLAQILVERGTTGPAAALIEQALHAAAAQPPLDPSIVQRLKALLDRTATQP